MIEMTRNNIRIDPLLDIDWDWQPPSVVVYIEMWFDVDAKFGTQTHDRDDAWVNLYAMYDPFSGTMSMEYYIETDYSTSDPIQYLPTDAEKTVIIAMIEEKCQAVEHCSCKEYMHKGEDI